MRGGGGGERYNWDQSSIFLEICNLQVDLPVEPRNREIKAKKSWDPCGEGEYEYYESHENQKGRGVNHDY